MPLYNAWMLLCHHQVVSVFQPCSNLCVVHRCWVCFNGCGCGCCCCCCCCRCFSCSDVRAVVLCGVGGMPMIKNKKLRGTQNQKMTKDNEFARWQSTLEIVGMILCMLWMNKLRAMGFFYQNLQVGRVLVQNFSPRFGELFPAPCFKLNLRGYEQETSLSNLVTWVLSGDLLWMVNCCNVTAR